MEACPDPQQEEEEPSVSTRLEGNGSSAQLAASPESSSSSGASTLNSARPPETITVDKVERKKVNMAERVRSGRLSPLWKHMTLFDPPLPNGKNVLCQARTAEGSVCGHILRYNSKNGTGSMTNHMASKHPEEYKKAMVASLHSAQGKRGLGSVLAGGGACTAEGAAANIGSSIMQTFSAQKKLTPKHSDRLNRKQVLWCIFNGRPWAALSDLGLRMIFTEFSQEYAASTPSKKALDKILSDIYSEVKEDVIATLKSVCDEYRKAGHSGGFCSLQLDLATVANKKYCTASASVILPNSTKVEHISLATKVFPGTHKEADVVRWISELTKEMFGSFMENPRPQDVFAAATVDQGGNVVNACKSLGIETLLCRAHRINSAVMWLLGIAGSSAKCKNPAMKQLVQRAAALVGIFSHSAVNDDALRQVQRHIQEDEMNEEMNEELNVMASEVGTMEEAQDAAAPASTAAPKASPASDSDDSSLPTLDILNLLRRNDTRWWSQLAFMVRLIILEVPIAQYLRENPQNAHRAPTPTEWIVMREVCCMLEYCKRVTVGIQGGPDGILSRSIYLCHELVNIYGLDELDLVDFKKMREATEEDEPIYSQIAVSRMQSTSRKALSVGLSQLKERKVNIADSTAEILALYLDPRYKTLDDMVCGNGDSLVGGHDRGELNKIARNKLAALGKAMNTTLARCWTISSDGSGGGGAAGDIDLREPMPKRSRGLFERRERARADFIRQNTNGQPIAGVTTVSDRLEQEIVVYDRISPVTAADFDVLRYWDTAGKPVTDENGVVIERPKFPLLSLFARLFLGVSSTSCQSERDFSTLATTLNKLRSSMDPERARKMMFIRLNASRVKEVRSVDAGRESMRIAQEEARGQAVKAQHKGAGQVIDVL